MKQKLAALRQRWPWLDRVLDVQERFSEVNGGFVSSGVTVSLFLAIFPLMLVAIAVVGFVAAGDDTVAPRLVENLGLTGSAADALTGTLERAATTRQAASVIGLLGLAWSGSGVASALQQAVRAPWQEGVQGLRDRIAGIGWLVVAALGFAAAIAISGVLNFLPSWAPPVVATVASMALGLAVEVGLFTWMLWGLGTRRVPVRDLVGGAIAAAIGFEALKLVGTVWVPHLIRSSSALYGSIGIVFALLAWIALFARLIVYSSTFNAVRFEAREGTREVVIHVPNLPGAAPVAASRGGIRREAKDPKVAVPGTA